jgi:carboxyl-terminal processing protease
VTITRDIIKIKSVRSKILEPGIGYVRISQFQERTGADLRDQLKKLKEQNMESLVLDLRNNPGGLLTAAVEVSEQFVADGQMVVYIQGRDGKRDEYYAHASNEDDEIPMVVLVNNGSASASEIVSGVLQDVGRAVILGTVTFGKGSVQSILPLSDDSGLRLTTAKYYTPSGRSIQNTGITPDILVEFNPDFKISSERKHALVREADLEGHLANPNGDDSIKEAVEAPKIGAVGVEDEDALKLSKEDEDYLRDNQLQEAVDLLKGWRILQGKAPMFLTAGGRS